MQRQGKRKNYSREFKLEAVRRSNDPTRTIAEIARELDIRNSPITLRHTIIQKLD